LAAGAHEDVMASERGYFVSSVDNWTSKS